MWHIQLAPRGHEYCLIHVYMKALGFLNLDKFNAFLEKYSNDHEIICKEQLPVYIYPEVSRQSLKQNDGG